MGIKELIYNLLRKWESLDLMPMELYKANGFLKTSQQSLHLFF